MEQSCVQLSQVFNLFFTLFAARIHYVYNAPDTLAERQLPARSIDRSNPHLLFHFQEQEPMSIMPVGNTLIHTL
jgi:hypothetical protein